MDDYYKGHHNALIAAVEVLDRLGAEVLEGQEPDAEAIARGVARASIAVERRAAEWLERTRAKTPEELERRGQCLSRYRAIRAGETR